MQFLRSVNILLTSLILQDPSSMLPPNKSIMFWCTTFSPYLSLQLRAILKTGNSIIWLALNVIYGIFPTVLDTYPWPERLSSWEEPCQSTPNWVHLILWSWLFHSCHLVFLFYDMLGKFCHAHFSLSYNCCTHLVLVVAFMSAFWVPKYKSTGS